MKAVFVWLQGHVSTTSAQDTLHAWLRQKYDSFCQKLHTLMQEPDAGVLQVCLNIYCWLIIAAALDFNACTTLRSSFGGLCLAPPVCYMDQRLPSTTESCSALINLLQPDAHPDAVCFLLNDHYINYLTLHHNAVHRSLQ